MNELKALQETPGCLYHALLGKKWASFIGYKEQRQQGSKDKSLSADPAPATHTSSLSSYIGNCVQSVCAVPPNFPLKSLQNYPTIKDWWWTIPSTQMLK